MNTLAPSTVSTRDPKGLKFVSIIEAAYNKAGLSEEEAQRVNETPGLTTLIDNFIAKNRFKATSDRYKAREIMGKNFFGVEEVIMYFGDKISPSQNQLAALCKVPWNEEVLRSCKDTHILVAVFPLSILDIRDIVQKQSDQTLLYSQDWYDNQKFAEDKGKVEWKLVRKEPIADSTSKTWNEQKALLSKDEKVPTARVVIYTRVGHFLNTGERMFEKIDVRCVDLASGGYRVSVGRFAARGFRIDRWNGDLRDYDIGVSAARK